MNCLIVGANFYNKGAQLMLLALAEQLKERYNAKIFVSPLIGNHEYLALNGLSLIDFPLRHVGDQKKFVYFLKFGNLIKYLKSSYRGTLPLSKVDVIFDISGFAYGDQWGISPLENVLQLLQLATKKGIKYIFMPQAFGPFSSDPQKKLVSEILKLANLVIARDKISYSHIQESAEGNEKKIALAPDITLAFKPTTNAVVENYCCIVPNQRMIDKGNKYWSENYLTALQNIIRQIVQKTDLNISIMIHDKEGGDLEIARTIKDTVNSNRVTLFKEDDPIKLKKYISHCYFIAGSRFHSLASGLSNNIPSLALGWSHKYDMLFEDYGLKEFSLIETAEKADIVLNKLIDSSENKKIRTHLAEVNKKIMNQNNSMWERIDNALK